MPVQRLRRSLVRSLFGVCAAAPLTLGCTASRQTSGAAGETAVTRFGVFDAAATVDSVAAFLGVPYALAPVGDRRWQAPQSMPQSSAHFAATQFGHTCRQLDDEHEPASRTPQGEDCLSLNVWTRTPRGTPKPVLVWIHGGSNVSGGTADPFYDGHNFVRANDVVFVSINYRLGPLGFLDLSELGGAALDSSRNLGLLDQLAALRWVRENIASFGGDARNVTVVGESAGGSAIMRLIAMPLARGLFDKAIIESGGPANIRVRGVQANDQIASSRALTRDFMRAARVTDLAGLRALPGDSVLSVASGVARARGDALGVATWGARADGIVLPVDIFGDVRRGANPDVKVLIGTNEDEMLYFRLYDADFPLTLRKEYREKHRLMGRDVSTVRELADRYLAGTDDPMRYIDLAGEFWLRQPSILFAEGRSRVNDTYMYLWTWDSRIAGIGAAHAIELPFVFGHLSGKATESLTGANPPAELSRRIQATWTAFATTGNPSAAGETPWPLYDERDRRTLILDSGPWQVQSDPKGDARRLLSGMYDVGR